MVNQFNDYERTCTMLHYYYSDKYFKQKYPKVWNAFLTVCESDQAAIESLNEGPQVQIVDKIPGGTVCTAGLFQPRFGNGKLIFISSEVAKVFEKDPGTHLKLQALALHECVHYARFWANHDVVWYHGDGNFLEAGKAFEIKAYGQVVNPFTDAYSQQCLINSESGGVSR